MVIVIKDKDDLEARLTNAGDALVVIDFFATWCGPCKMIAPELETLSKIHTSVVFLKVDVDECEEVAAAYEISSMPTFVFIKKGEKVHSFSGSSKAKLEAAIQTHK